MITENNNNSLYTFLETACHDNWEIACYYLNISESQLTEYLGIKDKSIPPELVAIAKRKLSYEVPSNELTALKEALYDATTRLDRWEENTKNLVRGGGN